jgi:hypothetical protein
MFDRIRLTRPDEVDHTTTMPTATERQDDQTDIYAINTTDKPGLNRSTRSLFDMNKAR